MIEIKTKEFYGPFDLLLNLIGKSKIDIYDIEISEITSSYIDSLAQLNIGSDDLSDFITMATRLLTIKTKTLIKDSLEEEDEEEELTREELITRLLEYKKFKEVSKKLRDYEKDGLLIYNKLQEDLNEFTSDKDQDLIVGDLSLLTKLLTGLIDRQESFDEDKIVDKILNIEEFSLEKYTSRISRQIREEKKINMTRRIGQAKSKSEAIIIFLSILELTKKELIRIYEEKEEIIIKLNEAVDG